MPQNSNSPIAAAVSGPSPALGQKSRSGPTFQFLTLPTSGNVTATIQGAAPNISATLMQQTNGADPVLGTLTNGCVISVSELSTSANYYIATPSNALNQNFVVVFNAP